MTRRRTPLPVLGIDRFHIFVPAIMSVGLVFWIVTLTRDLFRWRSARALERRSRASGRATAAFVLGELGPPAPAAVALRLRTSYLLTALVCAGVAIYIVVGSTANYLRDGGYVRDIAWLLAASLLVAALFGFVAGVALTVFLSWPHPPARLHSILRATPLAGPDPDDAGGTPSWGLSTSAILVPVVALVVSLMVGSSRGALVDLDEAVWSWASGQQWLDALSGLDTRVLWLAAAGAAGLVGAASLRCHVLGAAAALGVGAGLVGVVVAERIVQRGAPVGAAMSSFPAREVALAVVVVGLASSAVAVLTGRRGVAAPLRAVGSLGVATVLLAGLHEGSIWLSDAVGGVLIGMSVVLAVDAWLAHDRWHEHCAGCPWAEDPTRRPLLAPIHLPADRTRAVSLLAHSSAAGAAIGLAILAWTASVPSNPGGSLLDVDIQRPVQLALAALVSIGALVAWRWAAIGAVLIAVAGVGLGVLAGLEYRPEMAVLMTAALLVPAFLLWVSWQHRRTRGEIVALAVLTVILLGGAWWGAQEVYAHYFGATHPESSAEALPVDRVEWVWTGGLGAGEVTVVAGLAAGATSAHVDLVPLDGGPTVRSDEVSAADTSIVRMSVDGLEPDTRYRFQVVVGGVADDARGTGAIRTPGDGPMSFRVAVAACARVGSNGAVFDAIAETDPLLYLQLGDVHYSNLESTDAADFRAAYERMLTEPGQAALYRDVPIAYVWDDHDYGPNDAGAESPTRTAARAAYRQVVPSYELAAGTGDAPIHQAFTVGRVRFVLTDNRSERTPASMLGDRQERWLLDELIGASRDHAVVVWGNPSPWVGPADPTSDTWAAWADDRRRIADALAAAGVDNLVMLSGDAHMVALDDGTNTDYTSDGSGGFPLLHGAALDRPGSVKGGPYSGGAFPGGGQFATMDVHDEGGPVSVTLRGWTWRSTELVAARFTFPG